MNNPETAHSGKVALLPNFSPVKTLWEGDSPPFHSEQAARWALRKYGAQLVEAEAIAYWRGLLLVNPQKLAAVVERVALDNARARMVATA